MVGEKPQVVAGPVRDLLDERIAAADVPLVPDGGGEGVGVAEEDRGSGAGGGLLPVVLGPGDEREVVGGEGDVLPGGPRPPLAQGGELVLAVLAPVFGYVTRAGPDSAARPVVGGERPGEGGGAGGLRAEDDDPAREGGPYGRLEEVPAAHGVRAHGGAGDREEGAVGVDEDGVGAEAAAQLLPVRLRGEDRVHPVGHGGGEDGHVGVPDGRVGHVHVRVVDRPDHRDVRVDLAHPGDPVGERDRLHGGGADQHGQPLAAVLGGADEVVVAGVRRVELAEHQAVSVALHAATATGRASRAARSRRQSRRPIRQSARNPAYSSEVRYSPLWA